MTCSAELSMQKFYPGARTDCAYTLYIKHEAIATLESLVRGLEHRA